jgi:hypothetical protein
VIIIRIVWGSMNMASTADDAMTPGQPASPPINAPAAGAGGPAGAAQTPGATQTPEAPGTLDRDAEADSATGAGEVEATPGGADVPGGTQTEPPTGQPAAPAQ